MLHDIVLQPANGSAFLWTFVWYLYKLIQWRKELVKKVFLERVCYNHRVNILKRKWTVTFTLLRARRLFHFSILKNLSKALVICLHREKLLSLLQLFLVSWTITKAVEINQRLFTILLRDQVKYIFVVDYVVRRASSHRRLQHKRVSFAKKIAIEGVKRVFLLRRIIHLEAPWVKQSDFSVLRWIVASNFRILTHVLHDGCFTVYQVVSNSNCRRKVAKLCWPEVTQL